MSKSDLGLRRLAPAVWRYGLSVLTVAIATAVHVSLESYVFRTPLFFAAVLLSSWFGGTGPGLLAVLLSALSINFFFLEPKLSFSFGLQDIPHLVTFLFTAFLVSYWSNTRGRAERALRQARNELEVRINERTVDLTRSNEQLRSEVVERERSEHRLREHASLLDLTHDTIFVRDMNDVITYWNRGAEERYGWSRAEALGRITHELTQTAFPKPLQEINAELLETGRWEGELVHTRRDGTPVTVASRWALQRDESGNPIAILETNNDITERKQAEEKLRESEAYLAEAQRLSHTGSWAWAPATGEIRYWSEETYRVLGFDPDAGPPRFEKFFGRLHPEDQGRVRELFGKAIAERADFETEYRVVHPNGDIKDIHAVGHPVSSEAGHFVEFLGSVIDITERKRSEAALRASEQVARGQVEALAQSLDVLTTAPDPEKFIGQMLNTIGRLLNAQSVALWLFDQATDSLTWRLMSDGGKLVPSDPEHPFVKDPLLWKQSSAIQELLFTGGPVVCENVENDLRVTGEWRDHLKKKGTKRFLGVPLLIGGRVRGFVGIRHADQVSYRPEEIELTQALAHQVMLALQLNEFAEQGRRAAVFEERNRMARDIHDTLAQGFTGVIVQLEAAEDAISLGSRKEADAHLHRAGELARRSLSEARRSVHALRPHALEEHNFWEALKGTIKNTTVGTALHATFEAQGKLPKLSQAWQVNLLHIGQEALTNTLKYAHARNFKTRLTYKAKTIRLELRDDGDGFKAKDRHDGVGLSGMRERVEQMGGELEITSSRGKGTKITVSLPCNGESTS